MTSAYHEPVPTEDEAKSAILDAWRRGCDTRVIAAGLFRGHVSGISWFEGRVCKLIAEDQDRRHAARRAA